MLMEKVWLWDILTCLGTRIHIAPSQPKPHASFVQIIHLLMGIKP